MAEEALGGTAADVRAFVATGLELAQAQDDRAKVGHLADTAEKPAIKTAAETALFGSDTVVREFLRTRGYPGKEQDDRVKIAQLLAAGGPAMRAAGNAALSGTAADRQEFLARGRFAAAEQDDRIAVAQSMASGGPEVEAAAQIALAGTRASLRHFLAVSQYKARQRDAEAAAHVAKVRAIVLDASRDAAAALSQAADAARAAAVARNAAAEAAGYAQQAQQSAQQAAGYAQQAQQSAAQAQQSAEQAAQSAQAARAAAASAQSAARAAAQSAAEARVSAGRAHDYAADARQSAANARESAEDAGRDAGEAARLAWEALEFSVTLQRQEEEQRRRANQPDTSGGDCNLAKYLHGICRDPLLDAINDDQDWCTIQFGESDACDSVIVYYEEKTAQENTRAKLILQIVLTVCGFVPVAGEPCDALDALISYLEGDTAGGTLSALSTIPGAGWLFGGARGVDLARDLKRFEDLARTCRRTSSFVPGTRVLLAGGATKPIERVAVGDRVMATDPGTGLSTARTVTATITSSASKRLVTLTVDTDGRRGCKTGEITATYHHRFWLADQRQWADAGQVRQGQWLRTSTGAWAQVTAVRQRTEVTTVHNLTVAGVHTYYALAGDSALLVHNDDEIPCVNGGLGNLIKVDSPDPAADKLAERLGGESRVKFENDPVGREFDAVSDRYIAQSKPANFVINKKFRQQAIATFEKAVQSGRTRTSTSTARRTATSSERSTNTRSAMAYRP